MAGRTSRFLDKSWETLSKVDACGIEAKISGDLSSIKQKMEEEKEGSATFAEAWTAATEKYESHFKKELRQKDQKHIDKGMVGDLPEVLKDVPDYLAIAVIVCTLEESQLFFHEFNSAVRSLLKNNDWESCKFKGFLMLLTLALKHLPSRPPPEGKSIFRGIDAETELKIGDEFSFGYAAPFTVRRFLALGRTKPFNADEGADSEDDDEADSSDAATTPKTLIRTSFDDKIRGLGVKHLSPLGDEEREVIVSPLQSFRVTDIKHRKKKGFTVLIVEPCN